MAFVDQIFNENNSELQDVHDIRLKNLAEMNVGGGVSVVGYDSVNDKFGLIAFSTITGGVAWFGRRWRKGNASVIGEPVGDLDLGRAFAKTIGLGGYLVTNAHAREKLSPTNHNYKDNGAAADLTGASGHYQWGWNVPMYYQVYEDSTFLYETFSIGGPRKGYWNQYIPIGSRSCAGYAQMDRTNSILKSSVNNTAQYRGGNNSNWDGTWRSLLGKPCTNLSVQTMRTAARQNGTLWFVNERCMQYVTAALKRVIFGNRNIQAAYNAELDAYGLLQGGTGNGADYPSSWASGRGYNPYLDLSVGVDQGDKVGLISADIVEESGSLTINNIPCFYGLKNDYKYLGAISENMLLQCNANGSQSLFISNTIDGSNMNLDSVSGLTQIATGPTGSGWLYAKSYTLKNLAFFPGAEVGASGSTYYCDGYYNPNATSGLRGAYLLGVADGGVGAGSLFLGGDVAPSLASAGVGGFLCEWAEAFTSEPVWIAEN